VPEQNTSIVLGCADLTCIDSHFSFIAGTNDNAYGEQKCYNLAQNASTAVQARATADTFGYYAIYTNVCYRSAPPSYTPYNAPCKGCSATPATTTGRFCSTETGNFHVDYASIASNPLVFECQSTTANACGDTAAPTTTWAPTMVANTCQFANDQSCDEPLHCLAGTDCADCNTCTKAPTNAPTPTNSPTGRADGGPWACEDAECPSNPVSCEQLSADGACAATFAQVWTDGDHLAFDNLALGMNGTELISTQCPGACGTIDIRTNSPSSAPPASYVKASFEIFLTGVYSSSFDASSQMSFKEVVAANSGVSCGAEGVSVCTADDVTITAFSRRALSVTFSLNTFNRASASSIVSTLSTYLSSDSFTSDLTTAGSVSATGSVLISSDVVTNSPTPQPTPATGNCAHRATYWGYLCVLTIALLNVNQR